MKKTDRLVGMCQRNPVNTWRIWVVCLFTLLGNVYIILWKRQTEPVVWFPPGKGGTMVTYEEMVKFVFEFTLVVIALYEVFRHTKD